MEKKNHITSLLPHRRGMYSIMYDHRIVNFDQIRRRFMAVNQRTDIKKTLRRQFNSQTW